jgi:hypothetical protein
MRLAAAESADHDVNFMIGAKSREARGGAERGGAGDAAGRGPGAGRGTRRGAGPGAGRGRLGGVGG